MNAVVLERPETMTWMDVPRPVLTDPAHVLIQVGTCGICGSDLRYYRGENPWALHTLGRHVDNPPNIILGHEFAGTVVEVNDSAYEPLLGKRVGAQPFRVCGTCSHCRSGRENICSDTIHTGHAQGWGEMDFYPGAYAEHTIAWGDLCFPMPDDISFEEASMVDILGVGVHATGRADIRSGSSVLCVGGGPAGVAIALVALARGAETVYISDPSGICRQVASQYPGLVSIDPTSQDVVEVVRAEAGADGVDSVFDSVGTAETFSLGLSLLRPSGTFVNIAVHDEPAKINLAALGTERCVTTSSNSTYADVATAYRYVYEGKVDVKPWITHRFALRDFEEAFQLLLAAEKQAFKAVLIPDS
jgi:threonine dehydrogenase-like Zn-dependent dehydrogenase